MTNQIIARLVMKCRLCRDELRLPNSTHLEKMLKLSTFSPRMLLQSSNTQTVSFSLRFFSYKLFYYFGKRNFNLPFY